MNIKVGVYVLSLVLAPAVTASTVTDALTEKESRTPAQRKIDSQLLYEIYRHRGESEQKHVPQGEAGVKMDSTGRAYVDLRAEVTPKLKKRITDMGSTLVFTSVEYRSIIAWVPILKLEALAQDPAIQWIMPVAEAHTNRP